MSNAYCRAGVCRKDDVSCVPSTLQANTNVRFRYSYVSASSPYPMCGESFTWKGRMERVALRRLRRMVAVTRDHSVGRTSQGLFISRPGLSTIIHRLRRRTKVAVFVQSGQKVILAPRKRRFVKCTGRIIRRCRLLRSHCVSSTSGGGFSISVRRCAFTIGTFIRIIGTIKVRRCRFTIRRARAGRMVRGIHGVGDRLKVLFLDGFGRTMLRGLFGRGSIIFRRLFAYSACMCL